jgi:hypothetical protein
MKKYRSFFFKLFGFLVFGARIAIAITVMRVGYTLATGKVYISPVVNGGAGTGLFLLIIGTYFFFSAFHRQFFDNSQ